MTKKMHLNEEQLLSLIRENVKQTLMEAENENFFDRLRGKASAFFKGNDAEDDGYTVDKEMKDEYVNQYETDKERTRLLSKAIKNIENAIVGTEKAKETGYLNGKATGEATENFLTAGKRMAYILKNVIARGRSTMSAYSNAAFKPQPNYDIPEHNEETMDNNNNDSKSYTYRRKSPFNKLRDNIASRKSGLGQMRYVSESIDDIVKESIKNVINEGREVQMSDNAILALAKIVVEEFGNGNCIDLNNPKDLLETVRYVMRMERCDELKALQYMSGALGGGWG